MTDMRSLLLAAFKKHNIAHDLRAGIAALMGGESDFKPVAEVSYAHTSVDRIRSIFKTATAGLTDAYINQIKADPEAFFNLVYGHNAAPSLGNTEPGDGYKYRGRGPLQLTGRSNYDRYGGKMGVDLVADPDRENEPAIGVETAIVYMLDRYHGGGWPAMKAAVGNSFGNVDDKKNALFAKYDASGEWDAEPPADVEQTPSPTPQGGAPEPAKPQPVAGKGSSPEATPIDPGNPAGAVQITDPGAAAEVLRAIQALMKDAGFYAGALDGDFRGKSITAIDRLVKAAGQSGVIGQKGT